MEVLQYLFWFIEIGIFFYLLAVFFYIGIFSFSGLFYKNNRYHKLPKYFNRILVLVPAYKEDFVIYTAAKRLLDQRYPSDKFDVMIIADHLKAETLNALQSLPVLVKTVAFRQSTKAKSLNKAVEDLNDNSYDIAVVLDADNFLEDEFLYKINDQFIEGHKAIQGRRKAKNFNTSFAILDSLSENINNHIHRRGPDALGLSSNLIGSGMAFDFILFKELIANNNAVGGFDRELQLDLIKRGIPIRYLDDALIYDEKVEHPDAFHNQRKRWLASQVYYLRKNFSAGIGKLLKERDFAYFRFAVLNNLLPPNMLFMALVLIFGTFSIVFHDLLIVPLRFWLALIILSFLAFIVATPKEFIKWSRLRALFVLPVAFFAMLRSLINIKGANKSFIHTAHSHVEIQK